jgi:hypothetical protein
MSGNVLLRKVQSKGNIKPQRYQKSQALKALEKLSFNAKRLRYPNNPYLVADIFEDKTANGLTKAIIEFLRLSGHQAERISTTGRPIDKRQIFTDILGNTRQIGSIDWIKGTVTNGSADISATIKGRSVKIEVKIGNDRQSPAQKEYQKAIQTAFGIYYIARTFANFVTWYEQRF